MKWKIRLARGMAQEALVVIEAPTSEQAEAIFWHDIDPDVIHWSDDDVMGDREVIEICRADAKEELTPLKLPPAQNPLEPSSVTPIAAQRYGLPVTRDLPPHRD